MDKGQPTDSEIIELYWQRDEHAIKATDAKYGKLLFRIAYNILRDRSDCEECQNDAYLRIWNRIPPTRPVAFLPFISKIMRDGAIDRYKLRASQRRVPSELTVSIEELCDTLSDGDLPQYDDCSTRELAGLISDYVRKLPQRQGYIFIGRFYFGQTMEQIAGDLGISTATVQRETVKLKQSLKDYLRRNEVYL